MRPLTRTGPFTAWNARADELTRVLACDDVLRDADQTLVRAVDVQAPPAHVFRWLCQLRVAPYSYDLIDNLGRRSPPELTPGLDDLAAGQRFMTVFRLVCFELGRSITLETRSRVARFVVTYAALPAGHEATRLLVRLRCRYARSLPGAALSTAIPPGDTLMMRKQLMTLKGHAERTAPRGP